jgi:hypothetical protein
MIVIVAACDREGCGRQQAIANVTIDDWDAYPDRAGIEAADMARRLGWHITPDSVACPEHAAENG